MGFILYLLDNCLDNCRITVQVQMAIIIIIFMSFSEEFLISWDESPSSNISEVNCRTSSNYDNFSNEELFWNNYSLKKEQDGLTPSLILKFDHLAVEELHGGRPQLLDEAILCSLNVKAESLFTNYLNCCQSEIPELYDQVLNLKRERFQDFQNESLFVDFVEDNELLGQNQARQFIKNLSYYLNSKLIIKNIFFKAPSALRNEILLCFHFLLEKIQKKRSQSNAKAIVENQQSIGKELAENLLKNSKIIRLTFEPVENQVKEFFKILIKQWVKLIIGAQFSDNIESFMDKISLSSSPKSHACFNFFYEDDSTQKITKKEKYP